ncbi:hypothetical protein VNO78_25420 [Psophocarpus tetragonolobus]|uniref:Uncharacterized protein n=1 Tax=Psophocarpus tetragonolobus TaxID=3891 RepID=A0AAN9XFF0_PSOTE
MICISSFYAKNFKFGIGVAIKLTKQVDVAKCVALIRIKTHGSNNSVHDSMSYSTALFPKYEWKFQIDTIISTRLANHANCKYRVVKILGAKSIVIEFKKQFQF